MLEKNEYVDPDGPLYLWGDEINAPIDPEFYELSDLQLVDRSVMRKIEDYKYDQASYFLWNYDRNANFAGWLKHHGFTAGLCSHTGPYFWNIRLYDNVNK